VEMGLQSGEYLLHQVHIYSV